MTHVLQSRTNPNSEAEALLAEVHRVPLPSAMFIVLLVMNLASAVTTLIAVA
jgi:hypothetical protein